mgnify:CR=1 FL=1
MAMVLTPLVSRWAKRHRFVDQPGPRKVHLDPIPRVGGIVFIVATFSLVLPVFFLDNTIGQSFRHSVMELGVLLGAAAFVFVVGLIDDLAYLRGSVKLACLIVAALAVCISGTSLQSITVGSSWTVHTGWIAWPLTVFWIVMITVCVNLIDGLDGLAAGVALIVCATIALLALWSDYGAMVVLMLALLGSVTGFLFFNFHPAKIFMGDGGSMFLGFVIGAGSVVCQSKTCALVGLTLPFLVLGVPIIDTAIAVLRRRLLERRSMFSADRRHLHHRLLDIGLKQRSVAIVVYAVTVISASIGVFMLTVGEGWSVALFAAGILLLLLMFACVQGRRYLDVLVTLKRNWAITRQIRIEKRDFEDAQLRMREAISLADWWETVCHMARKMNFRSIGLRHQVNGHAEDKYLWTAAKGTFAAGSDAEIRLPIWSNGTADWEMRARIWVDGCLEIGGRQAMLLARLIDEFPPPNEQQQPSDAASHNTQLGRHELHDTGRKNKSAPGRPIPNPST